MDELDPAREIIVQAIATLEDAIGDLMAGQAPRSSRTDVAGASASLKKTGEVIREHAERIDDTMNSA